MKRILISMALLITLYYVVKQSVLFFSNGIDSSDLDDREVVSLVDIRWKLDERTFPSHWKGDEIQARAEELDSITSFRTEGIIRNALMKYPASVIKKNLEIVYMCKNISFYDQEYGGTNYERTVYVTNDGYEEDYIEETFHHEFSSVLLARYNDKFNAEEWEKCNSIEYWDESGGVNALNGRSSEEFDANLHEKGFLHEYATTDLENDLNSFAENIFSGNKEFYALCENYPKLKKKFQLFVNFYSEIDPAMDEEFFERFRK